MPQPIAVAIVSGGLDSTVLAYALKDRGYQPHLVSVDYGQRHKKEIEFAALTARRLDAPHSIIDLTSVTGHIGSSSLTNATIDVPDGHYAEDNMKITVVPNRNAIMLAIAWGIAVANNAKVVATGVHAGDHFIYPDCRPEFIRAIETAFQAGNEGFGFHGLRMFTPFIQKTKADIVSEGHMLAVPFEETWSCYKGGEIHCGTCGTCVERREAFQLAGVLDPTEYLAEPPINPPA